MCVCVLLCTCGGQRGNFVESIYSIHFSVGFRDQTQVKRGPYNILETYSTLPVLESPEFLLFLQMSADSHWMV